MTKFKYRVYPDTNWHLSQETYDIRMLKLEENFPSIVWKNDFQEAVAIARKWANSTELSIQHSHRNNRWPWRIRRVGESS